MTFLGGVSTVMVTVTVTVTGHIHQCQPLARRLVMDESKHNEISILADENGKRAMSGYIRLKNGLSPGPASDRICQSRDHQSVRDREGMIGQMTLARAEGSSVTCEAARHREFETITSNNTTSMQPVAACRTRYVRICTVRREAGNASVGHFSDRMSGPLPTGLSEPTRDLSSRRGRSGRSVELRSTYSYYRTTVRRSTTTVVVW